ncbi:SDR family oxidoreductase [Mesorhizobium sp. KR1-2]|uniref:SDR family oxidoreductase n=1 Tax=Mesorhizobium sp. KR1-2 TaxID=3156609 RepID=UPI0032B3ACD3
MPSQGKSLLVIGGTSDIAKATALTFAKEGWNVTISGRELPATRAEAANLELRIPGSTITAVVLDILDTASFMPLLDSLPVLPDAVLLAVGLLGEQTLAERRTDHAELIMRSNFEGPCLLLGLIASRFEDRGSGTIIGISSVAGDRGRASNYVYGAAKAGLTAFLSGLRNRLAAKGVHVLTVKPGFVRTRMTAGMKLPATLTAEPQELGEAIYSGVQKRRNVIYVRPTWWLVMTIIRSIPESLFKKLRL